MFLRHVLFSPHLKNIARCMCWLACACVFSIRRHNVMHAVVVVLFKNVYSRYKTGRKLNLDERLSQ